MPNTTAPSFGPRDSAGFRPIRQTSARPYMKRSRDLSRPTSSSRKRGRCHVRLGAELAGRQPRSRSAVAGVPQGRGAFLDTCTGRERSGEDGCVGCREFPVSDCLKGGRLVGLSRIKAKGASAPFAFRTEKLQPKLATPAPPPICASSARESSTTSSLLFKNLLYDLFHLILRPLRSILIRGKATRFSADKRVGLECNVTCGKRQAPH